MDFLNKISLLYLENHEELEKNYRCQFANKETFDLSIQSNQISPRIF